LHYGQEKSRRVGYKNPFTSILEFLNNFIKRQEFIMFVGRKLTTEENCPSIFNAKKVNYESK